MISFFDGLYISIARDDIRRRTRAAKYLAPVIAALSGGCSIHPVQQDVTGLPTADLVKYIRCETRLAIQDKAIQLLKQEVAGPGGDPASATSPIIRRLQSLRGLLWPRDLTVGMNAQERSIFAKYIRTGIAYDFTFDITEDNMGAGVADPIRLITNGTYGIGLSASGDYKRQNVRHFVVSETAASLLLENPRLPPQQQLSCLTDYRPWSYTYPISGNIGIQELISTFFDLNESRSLTADKDTSTVFADTLTFTTTLIGSVSPHVIVAPVGNAWGLANPAGVTASASRIDAHKLIIGLSLDVPKGVSVAAAAVVPGYSARSALQRGDVRSPTEQSALNAVSQARLDSYLDRAGR
jgi:hypothetical protein